MKERQEEQDPQNTLERVRKAAQALSTGDRELRTRLEFALEEMEALHESDFSGESKIVLDDFKDIMSVWNSFGGSSYSRLQAMEASDLEALAFKVLELYKRHPGA